MLSTQIKSKYLPYNLLDDSKYHHLKNKYNEKEKEILTKQQIIRDLESKILHFQALNEEIEQKKVTAKKETVRAEIEIQHLNREIEMKDSQINNLKIVCEKNEQDFKELMMNLNNYESNTSSAMKRVEDVERMNAKLRRENMGLLHEREELRGKLCDVTFRKESL